MKLLLQKTHYEAVLEFLKDYPKELFDNFFSEYDSLTFTNFSDFFYNHSRFSSRLNGLLMESSLLTKSSFDPIQRDDPQIVYESNVMFHLVAMKKYHEKIYYITPKLAIDLANTNLTIDSRFLISPFEQIYLKLDSDLFMITDVENNEPVYIDGVYVNFKQYPTGKKEIRMMAVSLLEPTEKYPFNDSVFYFRIELNDEGNLEQQIDAYIENTMFNEEELNRYRGNINIKYLSNISKFVFNVLLYITSKNANLVKNDSPLAQLELELQRKKKKKAKILQRKINLSASLPYIVVGQDLEHNMDKQIRSSKKGVFENKLDHRVYVSGHWRTQWYGSGEEKYQKQIQIEPYYKGPEMADVIKRKYKVI